MRVKWGEDYRGPGQADPNKIKAQREDELRRLMQTPQGQEIVEYYFAKYTGMLEGQLAPVGLPLIQTIVNHEYPNA